MAKMRSGDVRRIAEYLPPALPTLRRRGIGFEALRQDDRLIGRTLAADFIEQPAEIGEHLSL